MRKGGRSKEASLRVLEHEFTDDLKCGSTLPVECAAIPREVAKMAEVKEERA